MKKSKYYLFFLIALPVLAASSISFFSCPPIKEEPINNTRKETGDLTLDKWNDLLEDIYLKGLIVKLDLSECTVPASGDILKNTHQNGHDYTDKTAKNEWDNYIQFYPSLGGNLGKELITSIILPDVATMINNASHDIEFNTLEKTDFLKKADNGEENRNAFKNFTRLKSVTGKNIRLIGTLAFYNCASLEEVNFPNVNIVMQYAFYNSGIKKFESEKLTHIMPSTFENCKSLEKVEFHNARIIAQRAFKGCANLKEVSFSNVLLVEGEAFSNCTALKTARFLTNPLRSTTTDHPLDPWRSKEKEPHTKDTVAFHNNVFRGCTSLETLDVRNSWNVYFGAGALSDIGSSLELFLFDDEGADFGGRTYGHPQVELLLGKRPESMSENLTEDEKKKEKDLDIGKLTLKELKIIAPVVEIMPVQRSRIMFANDPSDIEIGYSSIRNYINSSYNDFRPYAENEPNRRDKYFNEPANITVKVTINGRPTKADIEAGKNIEH